MVEFYRYDAIVSSNCSYLNRYTVDPNRYEKEAVSAKRKVEEGGPKKKKLKEENVVKTFENNKVKFFVDRAEKTMESDPNQQCLTATVQLEVSNAPWCYRSQFDPVAHGLDASFRLTKFSELRG
ncbi:unnamed protein product [Larinioides sclopetarius]|uniref:Uncharacterized protein n=1 Tax=Larinioides sclopetarius TaxID=280406 RepID=A0AAV2AAT3_9ARAC